MTWRYGDSRDWNVRREQLERAIAEATLELFGHTGSHAFGPIVIPNTNPPLMIFCGEREQVEQLMKAVDIREAGK